MDLNSVAELVRDGDSKSPTLTKQQKVMRRVFTIFVFAALAIGIWSAIEFWIKFFDHYFRDHFGWNSHTSKGSFKIAVLITVVTLILATASTTIFESVA